MRSDKSNNKSDAQKAQMLKMKDGGKVPAKKKMKKGKDCK